MAILLEEILPSEKRFCDELRNISLVSQEISKAAATVMGNPGKILEPSRALIITRVRDALETMRDIQNVLGHAADRVVGQTTAEQKK